MLFLAAGQFSSKLLRCTCDNVIRSPFFWTINSEILVWKYVFKRQNSFQVNLKSIWMYTEGSGLDCPKMRKENSGFTENSKTRAPSKKMNSAPVPSTNWRINYGMAYTVCFIWLKQGVQRRPSVRAVAFQVLLCIPLLVILKAPGGGGGLRILKGWGCLSAILN